MNGNNNKKILNSNINYNNSNTSEESVAKLERMIDEYDRNIKIINFHLENESFYDLKLSGENINKITNILSDSSRIVKKIKN